MKISDNRTLHTTSGLPVKGVKDMTQFEKPKTHTRIPISVGTSITHTVVGPGTLGYERFKLNLFISLHCKEYSLSIPRFPDLSTPLFMYPHLSVLSTYPYPTPPPFFPKYGFNKFVLDLFLLIYKQSICLRFPSLVVLFSTPPHFVKSYKPLVSQ